MTQFSVYSSEETPVTAQESSGGGGGGGGGGGSTSSVSEYESSKYYPILSPTTHLPMSINKDKIAFTKLSVEVDKTIKLARITVKSLNNTEKPPMEINKKVYQYLLVNLSVLKDEDITNADIEFKVNKSWIALNNLIWGDISLNRYYGGWNKLATEKTGEDSNFVFYKSQTQGFSYFAITGEKTAIPKINPQENKTGVSLNKTSTKRGAIKKENITQQQKESKPKRSLKKDLAMGLIITITLIGIYFIRKRKKPISSKKKN